MKLRKTGVVSMPAKMKYNPTINQILATKIPELNFVMDYHGFYTVNIYCVQKQLRLKLCSLTARQISPNLGVLTIFVVHAPNGLFTTTDNSHRWLKESRSSPPTIML